MFSEMQITSGVTWSFYMNNMAFEIFESELDMYADDSTVGATAITLVTIPYDV